MSGIPSCSDASKRSVRFKVYEYAEEEERVEKTSNNLVQKYGIPTTKNSSDVDKYMFLQCFTQSAETQQNEITYDAIVIDSDDETMAVEKGSSEKSLDFDALSVDHRYACSMNGPMVMSRADGILKEGICRLNNSALSCSSNSGDQLTDASSYDDCNSIEMKSSSTSSSPLSENEVPLDERVVEHGHGGHEIDIKNKEVVVSPDFIIYGDMYCAESRLTFSCSCIKLKGATLNGFKQAFSLEWAIDDIVNIRSDWCGKVETAVVNLLLKIKDSKRAGNVNGIPGFDLLKFAVYDPYWFEGQEAIESLNVRYRDIWNITTDSYGGNENAFSVSGHISRPYFSDFPEPFEEIVYPKGDPDAVSISQRDVELLQPDTFINDTIIDFYIKYLKNKILPDEQHRFHFFNSFFFRKLADIDKDPHSACEGREAFKRVRKWTRKVNLFEKDYIFVPVNYSLHWSLIVICHPGEAAHFRDEEIKQSLKVPCILHMDSIKGSHRGLKNLFQSYLCEEWKERNKETRDDVLSKFLHLRFVSLELPQQENSFDCGLFLLHYVERFLEEAPANFSPFMITRFSCFLTRDWFLPMEASLKRAYIQKLIYGILEDYSHEIPEAGCPDKYFSSLLPNGNEVEVQVNEDQKLLQFARPNEVDDRCKPEFPSTSNDEFANFVVEDSEEQSVMHDDNESKDVSSSQKNILTMSNQGIDQNENYCISNDEDLASEPKGQQAGAKRSRLMPP